MGLTAETELSLRDAGLIDFYDKHKKDFKGVNEKAFEFAASQVDGLGMAAKKLRPRYWYDRFAALILDRTFAGMKEAHDKEKEAKP
jgi:hypothetical protein